MNTAPPGLYVEILIHGSIDEVWCRTQDPALHQRWDLRFSDITYLPRPDLSMPQCFLYRTRIGFGLEIEGEGESMGTIEKNGERSSALGFRSEHPYSLIRLGSGYWRYIPTSEGIRFLTWYDYQTRFGILGRQIDVLFFRPVMGWATAWSFDRLRLWIEKGQTPESSFRLALAYALARLTVSGVWMYHGLVPKLIFKHPDEFAPLFAAGLSVVQATWMVKAAGIAEIAAGIALLVFWRVRAGFWITIGLMAAALISVALTTPRLLTAAFNPVSLNVLMMALSGIGLIVGQDLPSARVCRRQAP